MAYLHWSSDLNTGIDVIDKQHKRIVDYPRRCWF
jgi:hemerythrin